MANEVGVVLWDTEPPFDFGDVVRHEVNAVELVVKNVLTVMPELFGEHFVQSDQKVSVTAGVGSKASSSVQSGLAAVGFQLEGVVLFHAFEVEDHLFTEASRRM